MNDKVTISLFELASKYPTDDSARVFLEEQRWNGQPVCPYCGTLVNQHKHHHKGEQVTTTALLAIRSIQSGLALSLNEATSVWQNGCSPCTIF